MLDYKLKQKYVLLQQTPGDWEDAIIKSSQSLLTDNIITQNYINAMIESVKKFGPYILIDDDIALAHARPEDGVNKLGLSVMTIKNDIYLNNDKNARVKLLFCLASPNKEEHLKLLQKIVSVIEDENLVKNCIENNNIDDFISYFNM